MRGDTPAAQRAEVVLRQHVQALPTRSSLRLELLRYLTGTGSLSLQTVPDGASLQVLPCVTENRRLVLGNGETVGTSPLVGRPIAMGSYVAVIGKPGYHETRHPLYNRRLDEIIGVHPNGLVAPIELLPEGTLGADDCYVPAGWCWLGGDLQTPNSLPSMRVWIDGFVIRRFPVTNSEYLRYLNALATTGQAEMASRHVPREQSSAGDELGAMVYRLTPQGLYVLPDDPDRATCWPSQPVTMIEWGSGRAYAAWCAEQTGLPWRLPMEFEWEKAARGVDGRAYPWGDAFDPSWACMKDSHRDDVRMQSVNTFEHDESVYKVRGTAGNTRDWCLDRFRESGPPLANRRLLMPSAEDLADTGFKSSRGGSYGNSASRARSADRDWWFPERSYVGRGIRLAWGLADRSA